MTVFADCTVDVECSETACVPLCWQSKQAQANTKEFLNFACLAVPVFTVY